MTSTLTKPWLTVTFCVVAFVLKYYQEYLMNVELWESTNHPSFFQNYLLGFKMIESKKHPYSLTGLYQKPLFLYMMNFIYKFELFEMNAVYILLIIAKLGFAHYFSKILGRSRGAELAVYGGILFNPVSLYYLYNDSVICIDLFLISLAVHLAFSDRHQLSSIVFGLVVYQNPNYLVFISLIALTFYQRNGLLKCCLFKYLFTFFVSLGLLVGVSFLIVGDFSWIDKCYKSLYVLSSPKYSLTLVPDFALSLLKEYRIAGGVLLFCYPMIHILPTFSFFAWTRKQCYELPKLAEVVDLKSVHISLLLTILFIFNPHSILLDLTLVIISFISQRNSLSTASGVGLFIATICYAFSSQKLSKTWLVKDQTQYNATHLIRCFFLMGLVFCSKYNITRVVGVVKDLKEAQARLTTEKEECAQKKTENQQKQEEKKEE